MLLGCPIGHRRSAMGKAHYQGARTRRQHAARTGNSRRTSRIGIPRANLPAGNSKSSAKYVRRVYKDAVRDLSLQLTTAKFGYLVEADIRRFFEHMDHDWLLKMLSLRIDDRAFLNLICKWLKGEASHRPQALARGDSAREGMDQEPPAPAGHGVYQRTQSAAGRALQLLWSTGQLGGPVALLQCGRRLCVQVAEPARG